jgi:hypothetical protein
LTGAPLRSRTALLDEAQLRVGLRHRARQHNPRQVRILQHRSAGMAAGKAAEELRERRGRLLDVAHAVLALAQLGPTRGVGDGVLQAAEFVHQPALLGLRTAPHAATCDGVDCSTVLPRAAATCR